MATKTFSLILKILKILIQNLVTAGEFTLKPVWEKTRSIASLQGKMVTTIGKCTGIMGGRMPFAPTIMEYYHVDPDSEHLISGNITLKPVWEKTRSIASLGI